METPNRTESGKSMKGTDKQRINPFLWFDNNAEEAVNLYISVFKNAGINTVTHYGAEGAKASGRKKGSVMTIAFQIEGQEFVAINGGPVFQINPTVSFFVNADSPQEIDGLWDKLSEGGTIMMKLDKYPFSERYGWIQDRYGVSWQLILPCRKQKIAPCLMFTGSQHKKAEEAIHFYISVFKNSGIIQLEHYGADQGPEGAVIHSKFVLDGQEFIAMDSHMHLPHNFNPAVSLVVNCETQDEIDYYWEKLSEGGDERAQQCGWLQDKYGLSWQIIPVAWNKIMRDSDPGKSERAMKAVLQMKKIDIKAVQRSIEQS
jgi:predicted 3-demethylubiquinone-9 3-methyltransferase (glyoxalase superfamily)